MDVTGKLIFVVVRLHIPLHIVFFIVYLAYIAFNITGTIPFELKRLLFPLHPVTSRYIAARYTPRHLINMNSPVPRFGLGSVQGRARSRALLDPTFTGSIGPEI